MTSGLSILSADTVLGLICGTVVRTMGHCAGNLAPASGEFGA